MKWDTLESLSCPKETLPSPHKGFGKTEGSLHLGGFQLSTVFFTLSVFLWVIWVPCINISRQVRPFGAMQAFQRGPLPYPQPAPHPACQSQQEPAPGHTWEGYGSLCSRPSGHTGAALPSHGSRPDLSPPLPAVASLVLVTGSSAWALQGPFPALLAPSPIYSGWRIQLNGKSNQPAQGAKPFNSCTSHLG